MKTQNIVIGGVLVGGLYYAYKKGLFDSLLGAKKPDETPTQEIKETVETSVEKSASKSPAIAVAAKAIANQYVNYSTSLSNPSSFASKVSKLQSAIGARIDGNPGKSADSETNRLFNNVYGLDKGIISSSNIDYYLKRIADKNTKAAIAATKSKAAQVSKTQAATAKTAQDLIDLVNKKGYKATLTETVSANTLQFNNLTRSYKDMGIKRTFSKGTSFTKGEFYAVPRGSYVLYINGVYRYPIDPSKFIVQ
jgi:hypothetical protein